MKLVPVAVIVPLGERERRDILCQAAAKMKRSRGEVRAVIAEPVACSEGIFQRPRDFGIAVGAEIAALAPRRPPLAASMQSAEAVSVPSVKLPLLSVASGTGPLLSGDPSSDGEVAVASIRYRCPAPARCQRPRTR
jgi:hypothetical protein